MYNFPCFGVVQNATQRGYIQIWATVVLYIYRRWNLDKGSVCTGAPYPRTEWGSRLVEALQSLHQHLSQSDVGSVDDAQRTAVKIFAVSLALVESVVLDERLNDPLLGATAVGCLMHDGR